MMPLREVVDLVGCDFCRAVPGQHCGRINEGGIRETVPLRAIHKERQTAFIKLNVKNAVNIAVLCKTKRRAK